MDLLDQIDEGRHDTLAILDAANDFGHLTDVETECDEEGIWAYAGLDAAQHPFTALLRESHNATCVVRDLDGTLQLLWQESSLSSRWSRGPLDRQNLINDEDLEDRVDADPDWLKAMCPLPLVELRSVLATLPKADSPVMSF
jgi:hypothetical protein